LLLLVAAGVAGLVAAVAVATASSPPQTVTLGSTSSTASSNVASCPSGITCTFVPFSGASTPELQVPFDGTVTSFSINSGTAAELSSCARCDVPAAGSSQALEPGPQSR
jgi:hypothetical protein